MSCHRHRQMGVSLGRPLCSRMSSSAAAAVRSCRPVVFCGPSGAGKSTLVGRLQAEFPGRFGFSVSHTTRRPRDGERDGVHYHFVSRDAMLKAIQDGEFIEHAEYGGNLYGTSKAEVSAGSAVLGSRANYCDTFSPVGGKYNCLFVHCSIVNMMSCGFGTQQRCLLLCDLYCLCYSHIRWSPSPESWSEMPICISTAAS